MVSRVHERSTNGGGVPPDEMFPSPAAAVVLTVTEKNVNVIVALIRRAPGREQKWISSFSPVVFCGEFITRQSPRRRTAGCNPHSYGLTCASKYTVTGKNISARLQERVNRRLGFASQMAEWLESLFSFKKVWVSKIIHCLRTDILCNPCPGGNHIMVGGHPT